jgi:hypothetical protein
MCRGWGRDGGAAHKLSVKLLVLPAGLSRLTSRFDIRQGGVVDFKDAVGVDLRLPRSASPRSQ